MINDSRIEFAAEEPGDCTISVSAPGWFDWSVMITAAARATDPLTGFDVSEGQGRLFGSRLLVADVGPAAGTGRGDDAVDLDRAEGTDQGDGDSQNYAAHVNCCRRLGPFSPACSGGRGSPLPRNGHAECRGPEKTVRRAPFRLRRKAITTGFCEPYQ